MTDNPTRYDKQEDAERMLHENGYRQQNNGLYVHDNYAAVRIMRDSHDQKYFISRRANGRP